MSNNPEDPTQTPIDRKVDQSLKPNLPPNEKLNPTALGNLPLADTPEPLDEQDDAKKSSWTMAEIERTLSSNVLKPSPIKIDQYAQQINRKSDLRLRNLSKQVGDRIRQDQEASDPAKAKKLTDFDIQSQTMRMVSANAAMGSYQFQKTLTLPYMRKSLALGYQKVSLLKEIVKAIQSSEKSVVSKLEAIKINTSSAAPRNKSYFRRLMDDVSFLNMRRVAGNISAYTMDGYEKLYKKYVSPTTMKMHRLMSSDRKGDGINGIRRTLTGKLNSLRRVTRDYANQDFSDQGKVGKIKSVGASIANRILRGGVRGGQQIKLGEAKNKTLSGWLSGPMEDVARFNPFSSKGPLQIDQEEEGHKIGVVSPVGQDGPIRPIVAGTDTILHELIRDWKSDYIKTQDKVVLHLSRIDDAVNGRQSRFTRTSSRPMGESVSRPRRPTKTTVDSIIDSMPPSGGPRSLSDQLNGPVESNVIQSALPNTPDREKRVSTTIGAKLKAMRGDTYDKFTGFGSKFKQVMAPLYHREIVATATPAPATMTPSSGLMGDGKLNRSFFTTMFERLGGKVTGVAEVVGKGNKERTKFEKIQAKWQELSERFRPKTVRKNSYEDIRSNKEPNKKGLVGRVFNRIKNTATSAGSKLLSGDVIGAGGDVLSDLFDWAKDTAGDAASDSIRERIENRLSESIRRGKVLGKRAVRGFRNRGGVKGIAGKLLGIGAAPEVTTGGKTLGRKVASSLWRGSKAAVGGGGSLLWKAAKGTGRISGKLALKGGAGALRGGLSLAKAVGPGALAGLAGGYASDWFENNTTGTTKRLGTTAGTMAQWGATGATIGSIIPGLGTGIGGAIGAGLGAIAANTDLVSAGLSKLGRSVAQSGDTMWTSIFGKEAKLDGWGKVKEQEQNSLLGNMYGSIFGLDAKYAKSGDLINPGKKGLIPSLHQGVNKFFFGDKNKDGKIKPGTSILSMMGTSVLSALDTFKSGMSELPSKIAELFGSLRDGAGTAYDRTKEAVGGAYEAVASKIGNIYKGKAAPVSDAKSIVQELVPEARVTSHKRPAGGAGKAGANSWHVKSGAAIDVAPVKGMDFETFKRKFTDAGYPLIEAIDETNPETMKKTGATGPHWHIVIGQRTAAPNASAGYQGPGGSGTWGGAMVQDPSGGGIGPMRGGYVSKDAKDLFNKAVSHLQKRGWSRTAAIGITTNLFGESKLDPRAVGDSGKAIGIAQWHPDRAAGIARNFGKSLSEMNLYEQLDAVDWELRDGKHVSSDKSIANGSSPIVDALNNAPNMEQVVQQMVHRYERPNNKISETQKRINEGYGLIGAAGQGSESVKPKSSPQNTNMPAPKSTTTKPTQTPQSKPKAAPSKQATQAPTPVLDTGFIDKFGSVIDKWEKTIDKSGKSDKNNNVISAPHVSINNRTNNNNSTSLKKERIRTGA